MTAKLGRAVGLFCLMVALGLSGGCGKKQTSTPSDDDSSAQNSRPVNVDVAEDREQAAFGNVEKQEAAAVEKKRGGTDEQRFALVVGVSDYDRSEYSTLKFTENDAEVLASVLEKDGYTVVVLTTSRGKKDARLRPTKANIDRALTDLASKTRRRDLLLIALAGHGVSCEVKIDAKKKDESFFCPSDAKLPNTDDLNELGKSMLSFRTLFEELNRSGAGSRILLIDACRNGSGGSRNIDSEAVLPPTRGTAALFSCKGGEKAWESPTLGKGHGVFFYRVIEGLKGKAKNLSSEFTWNALAEYVVENVPEDVTVHIGGGAKQTPHEIKNIVGLPPLLLGKRAVKEPARDEVAERLFREGLDSFLGSKGQVDLRWALKSFEEAGKRGHLFARGWSGRIIFAGHGTPRNETEGIKRIQEAMPTIRKKAEAGDPDSLVFVATSYLRGDIVKQDEAVAVQWLRKAADRGHGHAIAQLGKLYQENRGVKRDYQEALRLLRKAADMKNPMAMAQLGVMYAIGQGVKQNYTLSARWHREAAERGYVGSAWHMGQMYEYGRGFKQDLEEALRWYKLSASNPVAALSPEAVLRVEKKLKEKTPAKKKK